MLDSRAHHCGSFVVSSKGVKYRWKHQSGCVLAVVMRVQKRIGNVKIPERGRCGGRDVFCFPFSSGVLKEMNHIFFFSFRYTAHQQRFETNRKYNSAEYAFACLLSAKFGNQSRGEVLKAKRVLCFKRVSASVLLKWCSLGG